MSHKKKYKKINRTRGSIKNKYVIDVILVVMLIIGAIFIKFGVDVANKKTQVYSYTAEKSDDYKVSLKQNDFYTSDILPSGQYYASQSIKDYIINFKYDFKAVERKDIDYNYKVYAKLVGRADSNDNEGKVIWYRDFPIIENKSISLNNVNEILINEEITIDYIYYSDLVLSYEKTYGIKLDAVLQIYLDVSLDVDLPDLESDIKKLQDYIELDIPITNTVTEVKENYEKTTSGNIIINTKNAKVKETILYVIGGILMAGGVSMAVIYRVVKRRERTPTQIYEDNINHLLKYYRDLIVTVSNEPDLEGLKIMEIEMLDDLIDVAEQNKSNIIHYEVLEKTESRLYVIIDKYVYIYIVSEKEIK